MTFVKREKRYIWGKNSKWARYQWPMARCPMGMVVFKAKYGLQKQYEHLRFCYSRKNTHWQPKIHTSRNVPQSCLGIQSYRRLHSIAFQAQRTHSAWERYQNISSLHWYGESSIWDCRLSAVSQRVLESGRKDCPKCKGEDYLARQNCGRTSEKGYKRSKRSSASWPVVKARYSLRFYNCFVQTRSCRTQKP